MMIRLIHEPRAQKRQTRLGKQNHPRDREIVAVSSRRKPAVLRRCPAPMMLVALLYLTLGARPATLRAGSITPSSGTVTAEYSLTSVNGLPTPSASISGPQIEALIIPPGGVVPPTSSTGAELSPLTVLPGSTGFDPAQLVVALKNATSSTGQPEQMFGLVFFGQGFAAGGKLNFSLSIDKSLASNPPLLEVLTPGISIAPVTQAGSTTTPSQPPPSTPPGGQANAIPEPLSLAVWSTAALAMLIRARAARRRR